MAGNDVMFMASHGVTVVGSQSWPGPSTTCTTSSAPACTRCWQQQAAGGRALRRVPDALCAATAAQIAGERQQSDLFLASVKRMLDRDEPGWR
jgi:hypothetical protein